MDVHAAKDQPSSPQALDENFKRRSRHASGEAAEGLLARGRTVSYREKDTPAGHVIHRHPDGRIEIVLIDLGVSGSHPARRSA